MEYRRLGQHGVQVSALSYGSWVTFATQVNLGDAKKMLSLCYQNGVNFFDNAEAYAQGESEILMGKALKELHFHRDSYLVSSKVFWGGALPTQKGLSRKHVTDGCHNALRRLQVDYLDLYYCHRPDFHTPIEETVSAMHNLIVQGKVLYWGTSEWSAQQIQEAYSVARQYNLTPPSMEQPQYNLFHRERVEVEYSQLYKNIGLGTTIWSPLASGILTGKYNKGIPQDSRMNLAGYEWLKNSLESEEGKRKINKTIELEKLARELGVSLTNLSLAWCLKNKNVSSMILGASNIEQLTSNLECLPVVDMLTDEIMEKIESIVANAPTPPTDYLA